MVQGGDCLVCGGSLRDRAVSSGETGQAGAAIARDDNGRLPEREKWVWNRASTQVNGELGKFGSF